MQAVILAAGLGTRLRPVIGEEIPKVMLRLNDKPLLQYTVEILKKYGVDYITIVVQHKKEQIMNFFQDGRDFGVAIEYVVQENPKGGTADAVRYAKNKIKGEKFLLVYGDNLFDPAAIGKLMDAQKKHDGILAVKKMDDVSKYGIVETKGDRVIGIVEKPEVAVSNLVLAGLFVLPSAVFSYIEKIKPSKRNEYELTDAIQLLIENNYNVGYVQIEGFWTDPRDAREIELARQFIDENYG